MKVFTAWYIIDSTVKETLDEIIAIPLDSLLLRGVAARPYFCLQAWCREHTRRHARRPDGLKAGLGMTPQSSRLSNGRAMDEM